MTAIAAHPPRPAAPPSRPIEIRADRPTEPPSMLIDAVSRTQRPASPARYEEMTAAEVARLIAHPAADPDVLIRARRELELSGAQIRALRDRRASRHPARDEAIRRWFASESVPAANAQYEVCRRVRPPSLAWRSDEEQRAYVRDCERRDSPAHQAALVALLREKARSDVSGKRLEGAIAYDLRAQVSACNRVVLKIAEAPPKRADKPPKYYVAGEVDLETPTLLYEITESRKISGKIEQVRRMRDDRRINPSAKPVVLCAPNLQPRLVGNFNRQDVLVARTRAELEEFHRRLAGDSTGLRPENAGGLLQAISRYLPEAHARERLRTVFAATREPRVFVRDAKGKLRLAPRSDDRA